MIEAMPPAVKHGSPKDEKREYSAKPSRFT
jgi:hypothetical protein